MERDLSTKGGARDVSNHIARDVFDYPAPFDIPYEFFLSEGKKMSTSKGNAPALDRIGSKVWENKKANFDNIFNATVFSFGSDFINLANAGTPEFEQGFLTPSRTLRQRRIQIGLRFDF